MILLNKVSSKLVTLWLSFVVPSGVCVILPWSPALFVLPGSGVLGEVLFGLEFFVVLADLVGFEPFGSVLLVVADFATNLLLEWIETAAVEPAIIANAPIIAPPTNKYLDFFLFSY